MRTCLFVLLCCGAFLSASQAQDTTSVRAAEARLQQRQVELEELQQAAERGAASRLEVDQAGPEVTIAELSIELAKLQQSQYEQQRVTVDRMRLETVLSSAYASTRTWRSSRRRRRRACTQTRS